MLQLQQATYIHPNKELLFQELNLSVSRQEKIALIGQNGMGKSTLLRILAGELPLSSGQLICDARVYYVPQLHDGYEEYNIAEVLGISKKIKALHSILAGDVSESHLEILEDDWSIEDRTLQALSTWGLEKLTLNQPFSNLSGGQKTKVFLAGIEVHNPDLLLLDEPSNHLDREGREQLYSYLETSNKTILVVSHDRALLDLMPYTAELDRSGIQLYGGNYSFYREQKNMAMESLDQSISNKQKELRKAREKEKASMERQQKLNARGKAKQEKAGVPKIVMNGLRNKAEGSTSKLKAVHAGKMEGLQNDIRALRMNLKEIDHMKFGFDDSMLHSGKVLWEAKGILKKLDDKNLWPSPLTFQIKHGDRIAIKGKNGSGKTSLIRCLLGSWEVDCGTLKRAELRSIYIDQDYSLMKSSMSVYDMAQSFNGNGLLEHEVKIRLNRFLFDKESWDKSCLVLSGGERMRLLICCLNISNKAPDCIILDEPTNNIDLDNIVILSHALNDYKGTLLVVSHDEHFLNEILVEKEIDLSIF